MAATKTKTAPKTSKAKAAAKKTVKKVEHTTSRVPFWGALLTGVIIVLSLAYMGRHWVVQNYYRHTVESTLKTQLEPLKATLGAMGLKDLDQLKTTCQFRAADQMAAEAAGSTYLDCSAKVQSYTRLPSDKAGKAQFDHLATVLNQQLRDNGWASRPDLPTLSWFRNINQGVDYQPDQYNSKQVGKLFCVIDFYTAFSKPAPAAMNLVAECSITKR